MFPDWIFHIFGPSYNKVKNIIEFVCIRNTTSIYFNLVILRAGIFHIPISALLFALLIISINKFHRTVHDLRIFPLPFSSDIPQPRTRPHYLLLPR